MIEIYLRTCSNESEGHVTKEHDVHVEQDPEVGSDTLLERWIVHYTPSAVIPSGILSPSQASRLSREGIYKRLTLMLRSLYTICRTLPAYRLFRICKQHPEKHISFKIAYRIHSTLPGGLRPTTPLARKHSGMGSSAASESQCFEIAPVETPEGSMSISVEYWPSKAIRILQNEGVRFSTNAAMIPDYLGLRSRVQQDRSERDQEPSSQSSAAAISKNQTRILKSIHSDHVTRSPPSSTGTPRRRLWSSGMRFSPGQSPSSVQASPMLLGSRPPWQEDKDRSGGEPVAKVEDGGSFSTRPPIKPSDFGSNRKDIRLLDRSFPTSESSSCMDLSSGNAIPHGRRVSKPVSIPLAHVDKQRRSHRSLLEIQDCRDGEFGSPSDECVPLSARIKQQNRALSAPLLSNLDLQSVHRHFNNTDHTKKKECDERYQNVIVDPNHEDSGPLGGIPPDFIHGSSNLRMGTSAGDNESIYASSIPRHKSASGTPTVPGFCDDICGPASTSESDTMASLSPSPMASSCSPELPFALTPRYRYGQQFSGKSYQSGSSFKQQHLVTGSSPLMRGSPRLSTALSQSMLTASSASTQTTTQFPPDTEEIFRRSRSSADDDPNSSKPSTTLAHRASWGSVSVPGSLTEGSSMFAMSGMGYSVSPLRDPVLESIMLSSSPGRSSHHAWRIHPMKSTLSLGDGGYEAAGSFSHPKNKQYSKRSNVPLLTFPKDDEGSTAPVSVEVDDHAGRAGSLERLENPSDRELFPFIVPEDSHDKANEAAAAVLAMAIRHSANQGELSPRMRDGSLQFDSVIVPNECKTSEAWKDVMSAKAIGAFAREIRSAPDLGNTPPVPLPAVLDRLESLRDFFRNRGILD